MSTGRVLRVALYVCRPAPAFTMASLTHYALGRGRLVVACLTDYENPLRIPRRHRPVWSEDAVPLLESGQFQGLVVPSETELADTVTESRELHTWLGRLDVDLDCMCRPHHLPPARATA